jgi:plasmid stabilization system protein ParE
MRQVVFHPAAHQEFVDEVAYCERERRGAGGNVRADVTALLALLGNFPALGRSDNDGVRPAVTSRYRFVVHYELMVDQIVIWAIAHPAREPNYWTVRRTS